jgi:hypothetical protein
MPEEFEGSEGPENMDLPPPFFPYDNGASERVPGSLGALVEVQIEGVFQAETNGTISLFVLLSDGERRLPILIGPYEAEAIRRPLDGSHPDRPMTHDLVKSVMDRLGATLDRVVIDDLWNTTYYAKLYLKSGKDEIEIDARPSDSIAMAARCDAPIFVSDGILDQAIEE